MWNNYYHVHLTSSTTRSADPLFLVSVLSASQPHQSGD